MEMRAKAKEARIQRGKIRKAEAESKNKAIATGALPEYTTTSKTTSMGETGVADEEEPTSLRPRGRL